MKYRSYQNSIERSVSEIKAFLLSLELEGKLDYELSDIMKRNYNKRKLIKDIKKRNELLWAIMKRSELLIAASTSLEEIENIIVLYNILVPKNHPRVKQYKSMLFDSLIEKRNMDESLYCVIRHLIGNKKTEVTFLMKYLCNENTMHYHKMMVAVACIEHRYNDAYNHLSLVANDINENYQKALYLYKPSRYSKAISNNVCTSLKSIYIS